MNTITMSYYQPTRITVDAEFALAEAQNQLADYVPAALELMHLEDTLRVISKATDSRLVLSLSVVNNGTVSVDLNDLIRGIINDLGMALDANPNTEMYANAYMQSIKCLNTLIAAELV